VSEPSEGHVDVARDEHVDELHHDQVAKWERRWIAASGLLALTFVILIAFNLATEGGHIAQVAARGTPDALLSRQLFAEPGLRLTGPGQAQVAIVAQAFSFVPERIRIPIDTEVTFYLTSRDVIHGWQVLDTNLNVEVIPGEIAVLRYTFTRPGRYLMVCNQYCGLGHQGMLGELEVVSAADFARAGEPAPPVDTPVDGAALYAANCAGCHGAAGAGIAGAFPPLAGHAAELAERSRPYLIASLLYGLQGEIVVRGTTYAGVMPAWSQLSDEALAAILDHIVEFGGPEVAPFAADEVAEERGRGWTPADVLDFRRQVIGR
jgi:cytochrome c oxidase subunit II